jgi:hypothetical protein
MAGDSVSTPPLMGERVVDVHHDAASGCWDFRTSGGAWVGVYGPWQIRDELAVCLGSGDHGQAYGLGTPIDAQTRALELLGASRVVACDVDGVSGELTLAFDRGLVLRTLSDSTGYEAWHVTMPHGEEWIAQGGGRIVHLEPKPRS